jgi:hypothetical protein
LLDIELALPIGFVLLATAGLVYAAFGIYLYFRFERSMADRHVPAAMAAFTVHYALVIGSLYAPLDALLPMLLLFVTALAVVMAIRLGAQARSRAGTRIALAGLFTLAAFACRIGHHIYQSRKFIIVR